MSTEQITAGDILDWSSLGDIVASFEQRGLEPRPSLGAQNERVLHMGNDEYIVVIEALPGETAEEYIPESTSRHTNVVATDDFSAFSFISRIRSWEEQKRGNVKYQRLSFTKEEFRQGLEHEDQILQNINAITYQSSTPPFEVVRTRVTQGLDRVRNLF